MSLWCQTLCSFYELAQLGNSPLSYWHNVDVSSLLWSQFPFWCIPAHRSTRRPPAGHRVNFMKLTTKQLPCLLWRAPCRCLCCTRCSPLPRTLSLGPQCTPGVWGLVQGLPSFSLARTVCWMKGFVLLIVTDLIIYSTSVCTGLQCLSFCDLHTSFLLSLHLIGS